MRKLFFVIVEILPKLQVNFNSMVFQKICPVLFFLVVFIQPDLNSQAVFAPVKGAKWTYVSSSYEYDYAGFYAGIIVSKYVSKAAYPKDTAIGGRVYKMIDLITDIKGFGTTPTYTNNGMVSKTDTALFSKQSANKLMIRQSGDTLWALKDTSTSEKIYFVFTKGPDTVNLIPGSARYENQKVFVDSVGSFTVGGKFFKAWKGKSYTIIPNDYTDFGTNPLIFLDRIGPINDLLIYGAYKGRMLYRLPNYPFGLVCYQDTAIGLIKFLDLDCDAPVVGTRDIAFQTSAIKTWFDPSSQKLTVQSADTNLRGWEMALFNINGQQLSSAMLNGLSDQLNVPAHLSDGVYFVRFYNPTSGAHLAKKVLIYF